MDEIPKELEEDQLNLQVVIDPTTKCFTMKTQISKTSTESGVLLASDAIASDPLHGGNEKDDGVDVDFEKMNDLERLIYTERGRILNSRKLKECLRSSPSNQQIDSASTSEAETRDYLSSELSQTEKSRLRMRKLRERETSEEREFRKFRQRIVTMKIRFMQRIENFDNETYLKELTKKHSAKIRQRRREIKETETSEQRALRRSIQNIKSRMRYMREAAFKTAEEIVNEKERRLSTLEKYWAKYTDAERSARQKVHNQKARERYRKNTQELKKFDRFLKGASLEILEKKDEQ